MNRRAMSINTIDEVPDSNWFTNRIISGRPMTVEKSPKGPTRRPVRPGKWTITSGKSDGVTPGFTILDAKGDRWFIKFDPPKWREMATGAEVRDQAVHAVASPRTTSPASSAKTS